MNIFFCKTCILCLLYETQAQNIKILDPAVLWVNVGTQSGIPVYLSIQGTSWPGRNVLQFLKKMHHMEYCNIIEQPKAKKLSEEGTRLKYDSKILH